MDYQRLVQEVEQRWLDFCREEIGSLESIKVEAYLDVLDVEELEEIIGYPYVAQGATRLVMGPDASTVVKIDLHEAQVNLREWRFYREASPQAREWLAKPLAISEKNFAIAMERFPLLKKRHLDEYLCALSVECPDLFAKVRDKMASCNWGKKAKRRAVLIDYAQ